MSNQRRYVYLKGTEFAIFKSLKAMKKHAQLESSTGIYYVSAPDITFKYTRLEVLGWR